MQEPVSHATILNLEHMPIYHPEPNPGVKRHIQIVRYLELLAKSRLSKHNHYIEIPSINSLSVFFKCSYMEVYDACRGLRERGYDYQFSSMDGSIQIWRKPKK